MESFTIDTGKTGSNRAEEEEDGECDDEGLDLPDFSEIPGGSTLKTRSYVIPTKHRADGQREAGLLHVVETVAKGWDENESVNPYTWTPDNGKLGGSGGGGWGSVTQEKRNKEPAYYGSASRSQTTPPRRNSSPQRRDRGLSSRPCASSVSKASHSNSKSPKESRYSRRSSSSFPAKSRPRYESSGSPSRHQSSNSRSNDTRPGNRKAKETNRRDNRGIHVTRSSPDTRAARHSPYERAKTPDRHRDSPSHKYRRRTPSPLPPSRQRSPPHIKSSFVKSTFEPKKSFVVEKSDERPVKYGFVSDSSRRPTLSPQRPITTSASHTVPDVPIHRPVRLNTFAFPSIGGPSAPKAVPASSRPKTAFNWGTRII